jgi:L-fucose mutarotase
VLEALVSAVQIEGATVMETAKSGPYAMKDDPPIWNEFASVLEGAGFDGKLDRLERFAFYEASGKPDVALCIATAEQRIYANLLLTIGVIKPSS